MLDYVTIQKQGPYFQLHMKLSLFMYTGALRLSGEGVGGDCAMGCSHMIFVPNSLARQNETVTQTRQKICQLEKCTEDM